MTLLEFPAASFELEGEPETIRENARKYGRFATVTGQASSDIRSLSSGEWVGSEGDIFRTGVAQLPPHYDRAHTAFGQVSQALTGFADELDTLKSRMRTLRADAQQTYSSLKSAQQAKNNLKEPTDDQVKDDPNAQAQYEQQRTSLGNRVTGLESSWQQHLTQAAALRTQANEAAGRAAQAIRAAGRTSPTANQGGGLLGAIGDFFGGVGDWVGDRIDDIRNFIREHADVFRWIADAMKWVGGAIMAIAAVAAAVAAFIPVAGWIAELPIGAIFAAGSLIMGAGFALDTTVDWAEGKISGWQLLFGAAISLAGGAFGRVAGKLIQPLIRRFGTKLPAKLRDFLDILFGGGKKATNSQNPPGLDGNPLRGGTPDNPRRYEYRNPAESLRGTPEPTQRDMRGLKHHDNYEPGTREHMLARWREYLRTHQNNAWSWERWSNNYIQNIGREAKGTAYEQAFYRDHGFSDTDGWATNRNIQDATGVDRNYDIVNPEQRLAYELKSGSGIDVNQLRKDQQLAAKGWRIVYIFGTPPSQATITRLENAGIPYQVWHGEGVPVP